MQFPQRVSPAVGLSSSHHITQRFASPARLGRKDSPCLQCQHNRQKTVSIQSTTAHAGSCTGTMLLTRDKCQDKVLSMPGRESWRWPPRGHLGAVFLSRMKGKVLLFYL